ncbi:MAG TPA: DUF2203 domain-containing protein [Terriglobia bacterium]|nr:DUF2203 domain-containing protein [Terriglobia bacterium]
MLMKMEERIFTLNEAQALIPQLRSILEEINEEWNRIRELHPEIQKARDNAPFDGFSKFGVTYVEAVSHLMLMMHQIKDMGVLLKDVDKGLCDFPYMRQGRVVYLCWQLGEDDIQYWHDIEAGFGGREPLDETDR